MKGNRRISLIVQVVILTTIFICLTGVVTYESQRYISGKNVTADTEQRASQIAEEMALCIRQYPSYRWLLSYCYQHADELDIEYDAEYGDNTKTEEKYRQLLLHQPLFHVRYASDSEIAELPEEDQKLYAEITYSWLITRINKIKRSHAVDYLFCVLTDDDFRTQFFLLSAADADSVRGTEYEQVYPLGVNITVSESLQDAMRNARQKNAHLADAGNYVDYYSFLETIDGHDVFIGMTYDLTSLRESVLVRTRRGTFSAVVYQLLLSAVCLTMTILLVLRPLKKVQTSIRLYKQTKDSEAVAQRLSDIRSGNEISQLSEDVVALSREIDDYVKRIESITAERERMNVELSMAKQIQNSMMPDTFPPFPDRSQFDLYALMEPARSVGGDFYDFFLIDDDHLCLLIADVSGKGVPAALFMMASKIILQSCAMLGKSVAEILAKTNEAICSNNKKEMFLTVWLGILEISTGKLTAANAGHEYPAILHPDGLFTILKDRHSFVIGGLSDTQYTEYEIQLSPGSKIFVYTDGLPEATNVDNKMFGTERMLEALNKEPNASPERIIQNIRSAISYFVKDAEQFDDLTMLCLEYKGSLTDISSSEQDSLSV